MQQPARLRCDPTDYAKRQQEKKERAKALREQRHRGVFSEEHTFSPKVNPRARSHPSPPASREKLESTSTSNIPHNNNNQHDMLAQNDYGNDALDNLSRRYPKKTSSMSEPQAALSTAALQPEHDTLFQEVKRATGREIEDLPIRKTLALPQSRSHSGPCLRNSNCSCSKCGGDGLAPSGRSSGYPKPLEARTLPSQDPFNVSNSRAMAASSEMGNSLTLLKSKMSRRKARSAPTKQASLFVEDNTPSAVVHSARLPLSTAMSRNASNLPPRQPRRAPVQAMAQALHESPQHVDEDPTRDNRPSGFNLSKELDEYADGTEQMEQCSNCSRKFNIESFQKHQRICAKVFSGQRKVFNMTAKRLEGTEAEKIAKAKNSDSGARKTALSATEQPIKANKTAGWKQKSDMFRNAMKVSRDVTRALEKGEELPPMVPSAPDPSLIQCEYCSRRFNEKAAERHINFCREKSQRDNIKSVARKTGGAKPGARVAATRKR